MPDRACCLAGVRGLMERDWANIRAGYYRMPQDLFERPERLIGGAVRFFGEVPKVDLRRRRSADREVVLRPPPGAGKLPGYYLQIFHFQSDGYLSDHSARLYDIQRAEERRVGKGCCRTGRSRWSRDNSKKNK